MLPFKIILCCNINSRVKIIIKEKVVFFILLYTISQYSETDSSLMMIVTNIRKLRHFKIKIRNQNYSSNLFLKI